MCQQYCLDEGKKALVLPGCCARPEQTKKRQERKKRRRRRKRRRIYNTLSRCYEKKR
jgi:hypothetical protein